MRIGGAWVGLGLGDASEEVRKVRAFMRRKFSYAQLPDSSLYDEAMVAAVAEMQRRYNALGQLPKDAYIPGVLNLESRYLMGYLPRPPKPDTRPLLFTVSGTSVPWWVGPDADTARAVESRYLWQPIGFPAAPVPMGPSIAAGRAELATQMERWRNRIQADGCALAGYSQGAIVISETWMQDIRPESGRLHWAKDCVRKAVTWGNPCRERGIVWPDAGARPSPATNGGVTPTLMDNTPEWWREYAHAGDLYTDCPPDESGENRTAIWQVIRNGDLVRGPDSLIRQVLELQGTLDAPKTAEMIGAVKAMLDAIVFFARKTGPHVNYSTSEAVAYLMQREGVKA
jgi:hypothetical protein